MCPRKGLTRFPLSTNTGWQATISAQIEGIKKKKQFMKKLSARTNDSQACLARAGY